MNKIDKWFLSSQICSECGHRNGKKLFNIREGSCPIYHAYHDRRS
ncbi:transposase [Enterococcus hirae]|nr:transposase [Enterococcus hirae]